MTTSTISELRERLRQGRNADGGWGYYAGKAGRLEPTALALLALAANAGSSDVDAQVLESWPCRDGLLLERAAGEPNYGFHGLALLAMHACRAKHASAIEPLLEGIQRVKGVQLPPSTVTGRQDNSLQAWSWIAQTFSWVEPTAWCLLALKQWAKTPGVRIDAARLIEAERLLINRSCDGGGWNYGNPEVLGKYLRPYIPTTALALLAMQNRREEAVIARSLDYLEQHATTERSGTALGLALIALRAYGRSCEAVRTALADHLPITLALGNHASIALAAYTLDPEQTYDAFIL